MRNMFIAVLLVLASVLAFAPTAMSQVATGDEGGLDAFAPFGKEGQILAQATCTALRPDTGYTFAVKRICDRRSDSCAQICSRLSERQAGDLSCFAALHVYANSFFSEEETLGLKTLLQTSCNVSVCGPNYCCCGN
ncbi:MAG: hypothetical protein ETSY1_12725 [Candidatus Entotheonella factor]|uniref:Uncharacterized protein n=1 Tax=Entotheonella factor TaxID=1429438 RepID=W4LPQ4_ENTF1|nr:MAG: hypothetical protein ETSY1_12725 [Candidatus Entotheonella factor]